MFKLNSSKNPIGLDISDKALKMIQLKGHNDKIKIQALGKYKLEDGVIVNGEIKNAEGFRVALSKLVSAPKYGTLNNREVIASLPEPNSFIKLIEVEKGANSLSETVPHELEKHIPYSLKEIYYDWQEIESSRLKSSVLIGAAPRAVVDQYTQAIASAKLSVQALEPAPMSICRALLPEVSGRHSGQKNTSYLIVDIGAIRTSITVYAENTIAISMNDRLSGDIVTQKISQTLEIDLAQAEKAKIVCGLDKSKAHGIINDLLNEMIGELIAKIKDINVFFQNNFTQKEAISLILLTGGGAMIKDLDKTIETATEIKTVISDPFTHLSDSESALLKMLASGPRRSDDPDSAQRELAQSYTGAIGLALRPFFVKE